MKKKLKSLILVMFLFIFEEAEIYAQARLISVPQQGPDTRLLRNNYSSWEKSVPFDGVSIGFNPNSINTKTSIGYFGRGEKELCSSVFSKDARLKYAQYTNAISDLKNCNFKKLKSNFMMIPLFNVSWTLWEDDSAWSHLISNLEVAGKVAYASGLKGIILDTETYGSPQNLNLTFYCQQFVNKIYTRNSKIALVRIKDLKDRKSLDDLFPKQNNNIFWKDENDVANGIKLEKVQFDVYKDLDNNYYYPLLDPKFKNDVKLIISKVESRGQQIVSAISRHFPKAEIMLTVGPSYVREVLNDINGLNYSNNGLRTGYGLLIPLTKGMLIAASKSGVKLIDGQEQTYYHKTSSQFNRSRVNFNETANYFDGDVKSKYLAFMNQSIGIYARPAEKKTGKSNRFFDDNEVVNTFRLASSLKGVKYIWVYEEKESYWFMPSLKNRYLNEARGMSKIGGGNFDNHIKNIKTGIRH